MISRDAPGGGAAMRVLDTSPAAVQLSTAAPLTVPRRCPPTSVHFSYIRALCTCLAILLATARRLHVSYGSPQPDFDTPRSLPAPCRPTGSLMPKACLSRPPPLAPMANSAGRDWRGIL